MMQSSLTIMEPIHSLIKVKMNNKKVKTCKGPSGQSRPVSAAMTKESQTTKKNKRPPSGDDPAHTKKRITDTASTLSTTNLLPIGKGNTRGENQLSSAGPTGAGSIASTSMGDTPIIDHYYTSL